MGKTGKVSVETGILPSLTGQAAAYTGISVVVSIVLPPMMARMISPPSFLIHWQNVSGTPKVSLHRFLQTTSMIMVLVVMCKPARQSNIGEVIMIKILEKVARPDGGYDRRIIYAYTAEDYCEQVLDAGYVPIYSQAYHGRVIQIRDGSTTIGVAKIAED